MRESVKYGLTFVNTNLERLGAIPAPLAGAKGFRWKLYLSRGSRGWAQLN